MEQSSYLVFPSIDPVIFSVGPLSVRWYGLMYLVGFIAAYLLAQKRLSQTNWSREQLSDLLFWSFVGVILGGRIGYVLFYQFGMFLDDPLYLFKIWAGGMSFHGGLLGVLTALFWRAKCMNTTFLRLGIFPNAGHVPRHPSQLYEFALEGVLLFIILWLFSAKKRPVGAVSGLFLLGYGTFRFIVEYFREPDAHIGLYQMGLSQGQLLCLPMIALGIGLIVRAYMRGKDHVEQQKI